MFQEILFGQTRNPSKIFPNIFINIGDMGAEIIWRPLTARRRFMTKIFPHPLLYTLTLHWIHPLYTYIHNFSSLRWHSNVQKYKMGMQSVEVCIDLYDLQNMNVHCWRVRSNVRHAKCERTYFHKVRERRYAPALLGGEEDCSRVYNTSYFQGATAEICSLLCFYNRSYFQSTSYTALDRSWRCCFGPTFSAKILLMKFKRRILHG